MIDLSGQPRRIAIACGGTGGHLFPGLAIAEKLVARGCEVMLMVSAKEVDQHAVKNATSFRIVTLPAVCLQRRSELAFLRGLGRSYVAARKTFKSATPDAVLAMGGFTGAGPILAAKTMGARTFLHESNTIPGRANRWLAWIADHVFIGFSSAAKQLRRCRITVSGTPVRSHLQRRDAATCRMELGLEPGRPVLFVTGGSQGASGINQKIASALPLFAKLAPEWQWLHLTGPKDASQLRDTYRQLQLNAIVHPFFDRMELALGAASAAISRAGASSLAELAAMRLPSLVIPYPAAADNHQWHNAQAYAATGALRFLHQHLATPETLTESVLDLVRCDSVRETMQAALARWDRPQAADEIAENILEAISSKSRSPVRPDLMPPSGHRAARANAAAATVPSLVRNARPCRAVRKEPASV